MSTSSRDNRVIASITKPRRSPPGDVQNSLFFQGQGGRTVLPPISSAFPTSRFPVPNTYTTPYTQPRSSPGRYEINPQAFNCGPWSSSSNNTSPQLSATYPNYETTERYSTLPNYTTASYPSRSSSPVGASPESPEESRRLPPLSGHTSLDRWNHPAYVATTPSGYQNVRCSTTYTAVYPGYPGNTSAAYPYSISPQDHTNHSQLTNLSTSSRAAVFGELDTQRPEPTPSSPYNGSTNTAAQASSSASPPAQSATTEEPTIKKKRKRADANQLRVLNDTYARTAFPSTEERLHLAKILDMSPRSVQIWFQNKRQSMRQTSRQTSSASSGTYQTIAVVPQGDSIMDELGNSSAYSSGSVPMTDVQYLTAPPQDTSRTHSPHTSSPHQRIRVAEDPDSRKWARGY
ncbi:hypothetical protein M378DRAFT_12738 [Amanita muscaria Koide BX008]|uniref:Homeobox domain-containing protein n=1 Tax=Amanita muscaria (strain Koide BX008) TaxID=946122 RepID=A0A0C2WLU2_AMAMK|nr:hypothetical protein M378DRAFT_12738 [Amanita muscaria Koide BX008]